MPDTTIKKVEAGTSPRGEVGQKYLVAGKRVSMRLWVQEPGGKLKGPTKREYETVGYVISGSARLDLEGQTLNLKAGDSWLVPAGAMHHYTIIEPFTAIENGSASRGPRSRCARLSNSVLPRLRGRLVSSGFGFGNMLLHGDEAAVSPGVMRGRTSQLTRWLS
jgi:quercetin dioxygenase-like cupin family protein